MCPKASVLYQGSIPHYLQGETPSALSMMKGLNVIPLSNKQTIFLKKGTKPKQKEAWLCVVYGVLFLLFLFAVWQYDNCDVMTWPTYCTAQCCRYLYFPVAPNHNLLFEMIVNHFMYSSKENKRSSKPHEHRQDILQAMWMWTRDPPSHKNMNKRSSKPRECEQDPDHVLQRSCKSHELLHLTLISF